MSMAKEPQQMHSSSRNIVDAYVPDRPILLDMVPLIFCFVYDVLTPNKIWRYTLHTLNLDTCPNGSNTVGVVSPSTTSTFPHLASLESCFLHTDMVINLCLRVATTNETYSLANSG